MRIAISTWFIFVLIGTGSARADAVTIATRWGGAAAPTEGTTAIVVLTPEAGSGHERKTVEVAVPGRVQVDLSPDVKWSVELDSRELWTRPFNLTPVAGAEHALEIRPAGTVKGRLVDENGILTRAELTVGFAAAGQPLPMAPDTSRCITDDSGRFTCTLPLGRYDLRFKTAQRVPFYRWDHEVTRSPTDAGDVRTSRGGTIAGYLSTGDLPEDPKALRIIVRPSTPPGQPSVSVMTAPSAQVHTRPNGFFHTAPLPPGVYDVVAEVRGRGIAPVPAIRVLEGLEARLPRPLVLEPQSSVVITVTPPQSPAGPPWRLELLRSGPQGMQSAARGTASNEGTFVAENLAAGAYHVVISDETNSRWAVQPLDVTPLAREASIRIPLVYTEGTLRRAGEPVKGALYFGGVQATPSIHIQTDDQGAFRGMLPRAGQWDVDVIVAPSPDVLALESTVKLDEEAGVARAEVVIPDTLLEGMVVDTAGTPVPQSDVTLARGPRRLAVAVTNAQGRFAVRGLTAGAADVVAMAGGARSVPMSVVVAEGPQPPLRIVVHKLSALRSQVVGPAGPIPGARIAICPEGGGQVSQSVADSEGFFTAMGQPPVPRLNVAVHSPGLALLLRTIRGAPPQLPPQLTLSSSTGVLEINGEARIAFIESANAQIPVHLAFMLLAPGAAMEREWRWVRLPDLPPGQYRACSVEPPAAPVCASGWLAPGATLQLKIPASQ